MFPTSVIYSKQKNIVKVSNVMCKSVIRRHLTQRQNIFKDSKTFGNFPHITVLTESIVPDCYSAEQKLSKGKLT